MNRHTRSTRTAILAVASTFIILAPIPAQAAVATAGALRCEGASTVMTGPPVVSVSAGEAAGWFAWRPVLVNLNVRPPVVAQYGDWRYGYAYSGSTTPYWQYFDSGVIQDQIFNAPTTGYWGVYNFGYDYRTRQSFSFGYSTPGRYWCYFEPTLFIPNG